MKSTFIFSVVTACILVGCSSKTDSDQELITFDITEAPSVHKDLIIQDFMDVEYIPLETNDEFLHQGAIMYVGDKYIALRNMVNDGNIYIHDRSGKAISKINRRGQSGEEYASTVGVVIDGAKEELYVNSHMNRTIQVYDLHGNYKRTLKQASGSGAFYTVYETLNKNHCTQVFIFIDVALLVLFGRLQLLKPVKKLNVMINLVY